MTTTTQPWIAERGAHAAGVRWQVVEAFVEDFLAAHPGPATRSAKPWSRPQLLALGELATLTAGSSREADRQRAIDQLTVADLALKNLDPQCGKAG